MTESLTLQHILQRFLPNTGTGIDVHRLKVCQQLQACRTEALGGVRVYCHTCRHEATLYHSCRNRHCPQCQGKATQEWAERQKANTLPVNYFHLVFTLPHTLNGWVQLHPETIYRLLFQAVWHTLRRFGEDPKRLGGKLGVSMVLHTWGQNLSRHVHLHCLVAGGALTDSGEWRSCKGNYLFPVKALSRHFRGCMVALLREASDNGELSRITRQDEVDQQLSTLMTKEWVVYAKATLSHTDTVVDYLSRYTHRIAISNHRITEVNQETVSIRYKDYNDNETQKNLTLKGEEFVRRYLMHILEKGFMRVRHYGFLANCCRRKRLTQIRTLLQSQAEEKEVESQPSLLDGYPCPKCKTGHMIIIEEMMPKNHHGMAVKRR